MVHLNCRRRSLLPVSVCIMLVGCDSEISRLTPPQIDRSAASAAIKEYDASGDGAVSGAELDKAPALKSALSRLDADGDGRITADEIDERIAAWRASKIALTRLKFNVRQDGRPLPGAQVALVPEKFLGPNVKPASGVTDQRGNVSPTISDLPDESGVHPGFYRIEVSRKSGDRETIPERYNVQTELGLEVAMDNTSLQGLTVNLRSR